MNPWNIQKVPNYLTPDNPGDYLGVVVSPRITLTPELMTKMIKESGVEMSPETIYNIITRYERFITENLIQGYDVQTSIAHFSPRITGVFENENSPFDPEVHKLTFDMVLSKQMREKLSTVKVNVIGKKPDTAWIGAVTDTSNGLADGTITPNEDILIEGERIKVIGDDPAVGIFFVDAGGTATAVSRRLTLNTPTKIIARVPALTAGTYTLRIVTQYSNSSTELKQPRTMEYIVPLVVE